MSSVRSQIPRKSDSPRISKLSFNGKSKSSRMSIGRDLSNAWNKLCKNEYFSRTPDVGAKNLSVSKRASSILWKIFTDNTEKLKSVTKFVLRGNNKRKQIDTESHFLSEVQVPCTISKNTVVERDVIEVHEAKKEVEKRDEIDAETEGKSVALNSQILNVKENIQSNQNLCKARTVNHGTINPVLNNEGHNSVHPLHGGSCHVSEEFFFNPVCDQQMDKKNSCTKELRDDFPIHGFISKRAEFVSQRKRKLSNMSSFVIPEHQRIPFASPKDPSRISRFPTDPRLVSQSGLYSSPLFDVRGSLKMKTSCDKETLDRIQKIDKIRDDVLRQTEQAKKRKRPANEFLTSGKRRCICTHPARKYSLIVPTKEENQFRQPERWIQPSEALLKAGAKCVMYRPNLCEMCVEHKPNIGEWPLMR